MYTHNCNTLLDGVATLPVTQVRTDNHGVGQLQLTTGLNYIEHRCEYSPFRPLYAKRCHYRKRNGSCMSKLFDDFKANAVIDFLTSGYF